MCLFFNVIKGRKGANGIHGRMRPVYRPLRLLGRRGRRRRMFVRGRRGDGLDWWGVGITGAFFLVVFLCCVAMAWRTGSLGGSFSFLFLLMLWVGLGLFGMWMGRAGVLKGLTPPLFSFKKNEVPLHGIWSWGVAVVIEDDNVVR